MVSINVNAVPAGTCATAVKRRILDAILLTATTAGSHSVRHALLIHALLIHA
jgi:hypothetical protein